MSRDYPRLRAMVMEKRSAAGLDLEELLRLAEDPMTPPRSADAYEWAIRFAIPVISELRDRLDTISRQLQDKPRTMRLIEQLRKAQRGRDKDLRDAMEAKVDKWLIGELKPALFEEATS